MAQALKTNDIPGWADEKAAHKAKKTRKDSRHSTLSSKTFEQLSGGEKDVLLKALGVRFGLIKDSDDE